MVVLCYVQFRVETGFLKPIPEINIQEFEGVKDQAAVNYSTHHR